MDIMHWRSQRYVAGLYCFLRQASLSLDRIRSDNLLPLMRFYQTKGCGPLDVLESMGCVLGATDDSGPPSWLHSRAFSPACTCWRFVSSSVSWLVIDRACLRQSELRAIGKALKRLDHVLNDSSLWHVSYVSEVRVALSEAAELIRPLIHPRRLRADADKVYHLNHSDHIEVKSISETVGPDWLTA